MSLHKRGVKGFPSLADFIASDPDKTTLIFKRFDRLAARNLLHLQSELARLQHKLDLLDEKSCKEEGDVVKTKQYLRNWDKFMVAAESSGQERDRLDLSKIIQDTLQNYSGSILHFLSRRANQGIVTDSA
jgi:hypothetical protein